jgi:uncharacterized membrane protein
MAADPVSAGPRGDLPGVNRLLALSDGVVAIAITLLVLQLTVPSPAALTHPDSASDAAKYCWLLLALAPGLAERWSGGQAA